MPFLAQTCAVVLLGFIIGSAVTPTPVMDPDPHPATPTPCETSSIDLAHLERSQTIACWAADATATAYIMVQVTATPCDPWADENVTPIPGSMIRLASPCAEVAHNATWAAVDATRTAGIIDGSYYGLHYSNSAPLWTPTIFAYGTVPPEVLAGYPATLTAMPQETPYGWRLDGDRWVVDARRQP